MEKEDRAVGKGIERVVGELKSMKCNTLFRVG